MSCEYYVQFYRRVADEMQPAVGDHSVMLLDGRMSVWDKQYIATHEARKRGTECDMIYETYFFAQGDEAEPLVKAFDELRSVRVFDDYTSSDPIGVTKCRPWGLRDTKYKFPVPNGNVWVVGVNDSIPYISLTLVRSAH